MKTNIIKVAIFMAITISPIAFVSCGGNSSSNQTQTTTSSSSNYIDINTAIFNHDIHREMTMSEVRAIVGEPSKVVNESNCTAWYYPGRASALRFRYSDGRLSSY